MRALWVVPFALSTSLIVACGQQSAPTSGPSQPAAGPAVAQVPADATAIRGEVSIDGQSTLPANLELRLRLLDQSDPSIVPPVVAERVQPAPTALPASYALPYQANAIQADRRYGVEASLLAGGVVLYVSPKPVAFSGAAEPVALNLVRSGITATDAAPADVLKKQFDELENAIGGFRRLSGDRIESAVTIGWDAFANDDDVRFARENVDYGDAGTASFRYAYRDGQPWVVAREQGGVVAYLGWAEDGEVVLNRLGEERGALEADDIEALRDQAARLYTIVKARADRD